VLLAPQAPGTFAAGRPDDDNRRGDRPEDGVDERAPGRLVEEADVRDPQDQEAHGKGHGRLHADVQLLPPHDHRGPFVHRPEDTHPGYVPLMEQDMAWDIATEWMGTLADLDGAAAVLEWDRETIMPPGAAGTRGAQMATIAGIRHRHLLDAGVADALGALVESDDPWRSASARLARRERDRAGRLPEGLVREMAEASSRSVAIWSDARPGGDVSAWLAGIRPLVALTRTQADLLADGGDPYDALIDLYEPGTTYAMLAPVLDDLAARVAPIVDRLAGAGGPPLPSGPWDDAAQMALAREVARDIGFDERRGLVGRTAHPVTMGLGAGDTRLSTRVDTGDPLSSIMAVLHEGGHALYDQGIPEQYRRTMAGDAPSLGAHESQSRFWENHVGRLPQFWARLAPRLGRAFPGPAHGLGADDYVRALNRVEREPIRVESDEVTYDLHIVLRTRLERALILGELEVDDLPGAFDEGLQALVGVRPESPAEGAMQDIHWAAGIIGYFPTYTLGNLYAASLAQTAEEVLGPIGDVISAEGFAPLLSFLRDRVHAHGRVLATPALMERATGRGLTADPFIAHLERTYSSTSSLS
jgi:carboxypeptidase Taq